jgi:signal transduction histidine kinase/CheY-like chemotaxis protein
MSLLFDFLRFEINETNLALRGEQLRSRLQIFPLMVVPQFVIASLLVWMMWEKVDHAVLRGWILLVYVVHIIELYSWWRHRQDLNGLADCRRWSARFKLFSLLVCAIWGSAGILMYVPGDLAYQALLLCVVLGMISAAVISNVSHSPSMFIYLAGMIMPMLLRVIIDGDQLHLILAGMLAMFLVFVMNAAVELIRTFELSLQRRFENEKLVSELVVQKATAEQLRLVSEQANQAKSKFLATASHDLRQPLQALRLFADALQNVAKEPQTERLAGQIGKSVNSLVEMFDDLLDVSRLDAGIIQPRWQHFAIYDLFDRLYVDFAPLAHAKGLEIDLPYCNRDDDNGLHCEMVVYSDPFLLERMLRNLVSNAIRYTENGKVEVRCVCSLDQVEIAVHDTGIGIRPEAIEHIFEEYFQDNNPHRDRRKGLGLGLAIVRRVEELMGYRVVVESTPGRGSTFRFSLKKGDAAVMARPFVITHTKQDVRGKVIALVEDDTDIREFTTELMQEWGCQVFAGDNVSSVLHELDKAAMRPDMLVCDYRLPDKQTALDVMRQMRVLWRDLPVLVVTGDTAAETLQAIQKSGASLLHKPIAPTRLRTTMFFAMQEKGTAL